MPRPEPGAGRRDDTRKVRERGRLQVGASAHHANWLRRLLCVRRGVRGAEPTGRYECCFGVGLDDLNTHAHKQTKPKQQDVQMFELTVRAVRIP